MLAEKCHAHSLAAVIVEPLVQGAGGMRMHRPAVLTVLRELCDRHGVLLIFDEIFTGFGRTGSMFALDQAGVVPDILCLSKALSGGMAPLAATVARRPVAEAFEAEHPAAVLMHGPTYMANALACAAANASLDLFFERELRLAQVAGHRSPARSGPGAMPRPARRGGRTGHGRHRRGGAGRRDARPVERDWRFDRARRVDLPVRTHRLSDAAASIIGDGRRWPD